MVEAILVAVLVLSAVAFLTVANRSTGGGGAASADLSQTARDTFSRLRHQDLLIDGLEQPFDDVMDGILRGNATAVAAAEEYVESILPAGALYQLRLSNGVEPMRIIPEGSPGEPRAAGVADIAWLANWTRFGPTQAPYLTPGGTYSPGLDLDLIALDNAACVRAPYGYGLVGPSGSNKPNGEPWLDSFADGAVPRDAPYGVWASYGDATCLVETGRFTLERSGCAGACASIYTTYSLQLVVWYGV